eukprot:g14875.t1
MSSEAWLVRDVDSASDAGGLSAASSAGSEAGPTASDVVPAPKPAVAFAPSSNIQTARANQTGRDHQASSSTTSSRNYYQPGAATSAATSSRDRSPGTVEPGESTRTRFGNQAFEPPKRGLAGLAKKSGARAFPQLGLGPKKTYDLKIDRGLRENRDRSRSPEAPDPDGRPESGDGYRVRHASRGRLILDCEETTGDERNNAAVEEPDPGAGAMEGPSSVDLVADTFAGNFISYMCLAKARTPLTGGKEGGRGETRTPDAKFGAPLANTASASGLTTRRQKKSDLMKIQQKIMNGEES